MNNGARGFASLCIALTVVFSVFLTCSSNNSPSGQYAVMQAASQGVEACAAILSSNDILYRNSDTLIVIARGNFFVYCNYSFLTLTSTGNDTVLFTYYHTPGSICTGAGYLDDRVKVLSEGSARIIVQEQGGANVLVDTLIQTADIKTPSPCP